MSRSTQYIGLTKKAQDWIGKNEWEHVFNSKNWTCGMFMEKVSLGEWRYSHSGLYIREVVQAEPWSSGPMIFTCLALAEKKAEGKYSNDGMYGDEFLPPEDSESLKPIPGFEWVKDEFVKSSEFDEVRGLFWV